MSGLKLWPRQTRHLAYKRLKQVDVRDLSTFDCREALLQQWNNICHNGCNEMQATLKGQGTGMGVQTRSISDQGVEVSVGILKV